MHPSQDVKPQGEGVVFKVGVHVEIVEGDTVYKAKILSVDWHNTQVSVHFINFKQRFDRAVKSLSGKQTGEIL